MKIELTAKTKKQLSKLPKNSSTKVVYKIEALYSSPYLGKKLTGKLGDKYSLRAWPYRIIYQIIKNKQIILIITTEHRQGVYK